MVGVPVAAGAMLLAVIPPVAAEELPVSVASSGPAKVVTDTDSSTGRIVATFTITDPTLTATGATICRSWGDEARQGCRYQRFDGQSVVDEWDDEYVDDDEYTRWDIVGQPGSWTVSYPIGFDGITREQCLTAAWDDPVFTASMQVQNDAGVVIGTGSFAYDVVCTGIEGSSSGPARSKVSASRSVKSKPFAFVVLDTRRVLASYRICQYDSIGGRYYDCDMERLTARNRLRDGTGWGLSYTITWRAMGSQLCDYIDRKWPQAGLRVQYFDRSGDRVLTLFRGTRLDC